MLLAFFSPAGIVEAILNNITISHVKNGSTASDVVQTHAGFNAQQLLAPCKSITVRTPAIQIGILNT